MALRRKRMKDNTGAFIQDFVKCAFCGQEDTYMTVHGGYIHGGGKPCCDDCFEDLRHKEDYLQCRESLFEPSEADFQTWMKL